MSARYPGHLAFPFRIGADGRPARPADLSEHVRDEVMQLLLTNLGERPFLPEFGSNVRRLVWENIDDTALSLTKATIAEALSRWLGGRVEVEDIDVKAEDSTIEIELSYRVAGTEDSRVLRFQRSGG